MVQPRALLLALVALLLAAAPALSCCAMAQTHEEAAAAAAIHDCGHGMAEAPPTPEGHEECDGCEDCLPSAGEPVRLSGHEAEPGPALLALALMPSADSTLKPQIRYWRPPPTAPPPPTPVALHIKITV